LSLIGNGTVRNFSLSQRNVQIFHRMGIGAHFVHRAVIFTMGELAYDKLFILCWRIYRTVRNFNFTVRKFFTVQVLANDKYRAMNDTANPILFIF
jgi:hypothetical protein